MNVGSRNNWLCGEVAVVADQRRLIWQGVDAFADTSRLVVAGTCECEAQPETGRASGNCWRCTSRQRGASAFSPRCCGSGRHSSVGGVRSFGVGSGLCGRFRLPCTTTTRPLSGGGPRWHVPSSASRAGFLEIPSTLTIRSSLSMVD